MSPSRSADAAPVSLTAGAQVGRYTVVRRLGAGGMGTVYVAHDPELERDVAVKLVRLGEGGSRRRVFREAKAIARLAHPNVVAVYDTGTLGDHVFIAMELVDGGTLREWLQAAARAPEDVVAMFVQAGRGLAAAHDAGLVHRDFKPDNVLVGKDGRARVSDFGLARTDAAEPSAEDAPPAADLSTVMSQTGEIMGTPVYMAPEQLRGERCDLRADVFAFSVAIYEALYGERPFEGATVDELRLAIERGRVRTAPRNADVPERLREAVLRGLRARPGERYASMRELLIAIEHVGPPPASATKPTRADGRPLRIIVGAGGMTVLAAGIGAFLFAGRSNLGAAPSDIASTPATSIRREDPARPVRECEKNADCARAHRPAPRICRPSDGKCTALESEDCKVLAEPGDVENDRTIWFGLMFPTSGPKAPLGQRFENAADLARRDFAQMAHGLPSATNGSATRPLALVACNDAEEPTRPARHLVDDLHVPAIVGFASTQEVIDLSLSTFIPKRVLTIPTANNSTFVTSIPQPPNEPRLVWRTNISTREYQRIAALVVRDLLEPRLREQGLGPRTPMRIAFVRPATATGLAVSNDLIPALRFNNGADIVHNQSYFRELVIGSNEDYSGVVDQLMKWRPSIVLYVAPFPDVVEHLIAPLEAKWASAGPRPIFFAGASISDSRALFQAMGKDASRRRRYFGLAPSANTARNAKLTLRYNETFAPKVTLNESPASPYDSVYLLAYAAFVVGDEPLTGPNLGRAIPRLLPPGKAVDVGPSEILGAFAELRRGANIDLRGAQTSLDFDVQTGDTSGDIVLQCVGVDDEGRAVDGIDSGVEFDAKTGQLRGTLHCP